MPTINVAVNSKPAVEGYQALVTATNQATNVTSNFSRGIQDTEKSAGSFGKSLISLKGLVAGFIGVLAVKKSFNFFRELTQDTADYADSILDLNKRLGLTPEFLSVIKVAAEQNGTTLEGVTSSLKLLEKAFNDFAVNGDETIGKVIGFLGDDFKKAVEEGLPLEALTLKLSQRFKELGASEKLFVAQELFSRGGPESIPVFLEDLEKIEQGVRKAGGIVTKEFGQAGDEFNDTVNSLQLSFTGLRNTIIGELLPPITAKLDDLRTTLDDNQDSIIAFASAGIRAFSNFAKIAGESFSVVIGAVAGFGDIIDEGLIAARKLDKKFAESIDSIFGGQSEQIKATEAEIKRLEDNIKFRDLGAEDVTKDINKLTVATSKALDEFADVLAKKAERIAALKQGFVGPLPEQAGLPATTGRSVFAGGEARDRSALREIKRLEDEAKALKKLNDERADATAKLDEFTAKLKVETATASDSDAERQKQLTLLELEGLLRKAGNKDISTSLQFYSEEIDKLNDLNEARKKQVETEKKQTEGRKNFQDDLNAIKLEIDTIGQSNEAKELAAALEEQRKKLRDAEIDNNEELLELYKAQFVELQKLRKLESLGADIGNSFGDAIGKLIDDLDTFKDTLQAFLKDVNRAIIQAFVIDPVKKGATELVTKALVSIGSSIGGSLSRSGTSSTDINIEGTSSQANVDEILAQLNASNYLGAVYQGSRRMMFKGDIVNRPTFSPAINSFFGEAGAEAVMPLGRDSSGRLGVRSVDGGGGRQVFNFNISTPNPDGFRKSKRQIAMDAKRAARL